MKPLISTEIIDEYYSALQARMGIALYRLPQKGQVQIICGRISRNLKDDAKGFVFAPFDPSVDPYFIAANSEHLQNVMQHKETSNIESAPIKSNTKDQFINLVKSITNAIDTGVFKKIVAARVLAIDRSKDFDELNFFAKICEEYPHAFASLVLIPEVGLWIGASPEVLASQNGEELISYSLAGTKAVEDESSWTEKELEEQQLVTDFIYEHLKKITEGAIETEGPMSHKAGKLKHLLTKFSIRTAYSNLWQKVIKTLHPTPAVSGLPKNNAVAFLKKNEVFDRRFYAGYLGPFNDEGNTDIFVNLRCMEVTEKQLLFYAGCGVTHSSDPEKEWIESERKIDILRGLL